MKTFGIIQSITKNIQICLKHWKNIAQMHRNAETCEATALTGWKLFSSLHYEVIVGVVKTNIKLLARVSREEKNKRIELSV